HMHVLVCVEPTYFKNTENYVNQKQWIQFWKKAMKLDYDPNVKVQMIRPKNKYKSDIQSAIDETAKYPVKDTDFMTDDEEKNRSEEHTSELQSRFDIVCRLLLEKKKITKNDTHK